MTNPKVNSPEKETQISESDETAVPAEVDNSSPTRFGDWEKNGRCIDF
ncbi:DUF1674 domain-containing protein [Candidatus Odyssella thessalonicensis]|nr:DUF1674 domain-containing protein [Candidatus Odyssella thessalonicensis]